MKWAVIALAVGLAVGAAGGWTAQGWHRDSVNLAVNEAAQAIKDDAVGRESSIAQQVEEALAERQVVERVIDRGVIREVQKPIYQRVCFDPELVRLLNEGARITPAAAGGNPGKPAGAVP